MMFENFKGNGAEFRFGCFINRVREILALDDSVSRNRNDFRAVSFGEFGFFGFGRSRHAGELVVQPEIVLNGDCRDSLRFELHFQIVLGFERFVQAFGIAAARHFAAREFVHDHNFALSVFGIHVNDIINFAVKQRIRLDGLIQHRLHFLQLRGGQSAATLGGQAEYSVHNCGDGFIGGFDLRLLDQSDFFIRQNVGG